jgi:abortive infection bacteriophage resistance protein
MEFPANVYEIDGLIDILESQNLVIPDKEFAKATLLSVGYVPFKRYFHLFCQNHSPRKFKNGVYFDDILHLYNTDSALRIALLEGLFKIELSVKAAINEVMTINHGSHWYLDQELFNKSFTSSHDPTLNSQHEDLLVKIRKDCKSSEDQGVSGYLSMYTTPDLPPSWMVLDLLSYTKVSMLYENILPTDDRWSIAKYFKVPDNVLKSWLKSFAYIRNLSAHHQKIIYHRLSIIPIMPTKSTNRFLKDYDIVDSRKLYASLSCMQFLLKNIDRENNFRYYLFQLLECSSLELDRLGFTPNWKDELIWQE